MNENSNPQQYKEHKSLYQILIDELMQRISNNQFSFETPLCTEKQLMDEFQVSRITAKRAINELEYRGVLYRKRGCGSFVSRDIYSGRHTAVKNTHILALIMPFGIVNQFLLDMVQRINAKINSENCFLSIFIAGQSGYKEQAILNQLLDQDISGLLYYPCSMSIHLDILNQFVLRNIPVFLIDRPTTVPYLNCAHCDNIAGSRLLTEHLISLGHTKIAFLSEQGITSLPSIYERFGGYLAAMRDANLPVDPSYIVPEIRNGAESREIYLKAVQRLYCNGITAIECENDGIACRVIDCCKELSIAVPGDMSVCGFDANNSEITSIYQNEVEMADRIGEAFLNCLNQKAALPKHIVVPVKLVPGSTAGPCPKTTVQ